MTTSPTSLVSDMAEAKIGWVCPRQKLARCADRLQGTGLPLVGVERTLATDAKDPSETKLLCGGY
jgi:hypothetical protein